MIPNRLVLDTNVCLDLFVFHDPRWHALENALRTGQIQAVTRHDCRAEWMLVLRYACFNLSEEVRHACMTQFDALTLCLSVTPGSPPPYLELPRCSDPDDQKFLELAHESGATTLITKDKALLKLAGKCRRAGFFTIQKPEAWVQATIVTSLATR